MEREKAWEIVAANKQTLTTCYYSAPSPHRDWTTGEGGETVKEGWFSVIWEENRFLDLGEAGQEIGSILDSQGQTGKDFELLKIVLAKEEKKIDHETKNFLD